MDYISDYVNYALTDADKTALISHWRDSSKANNKKYLTFCKILKQFEKKLQKDVCVDFFYHYEFEIMESIKDNKNIQEFIHKHFKDSKLFQNIYKEFEFFKKAIIRTANQLDNFKDTRDIKDFLWEEFGDGQSLVHSNDILFSAYSDVIAHQFITYRNNENVADTLAPVLVRELLSAHSEIIRKRLF
ncbi:hypothetical protein [Mycoplasmopsis agalactiae]|nr:hypothetical protein [Mycoplasmopsis agalactiae]